MRSPLRPLPAAVTRWTATARVLGWLDALAAYLAIWGGAAVAFPSASRASLAVLAAAVTALGALLRARLSREYLYVASDQLANASTSRAVTRKYAGEERAGSSPALVS